MGLPGPKDLVRHGCRKSRAPFKLALRSPFCVAQINASVWWVKPPSSGGCFVHDNQAFWTSDGCGHRSYLPARLPLQLNRLDIFYPRNSPTAPTTDATTPPTNIQIALSVGDPVKKREMSEVNDVDAMMPKIMSRIPPARSASETALFMFVTTVQKSRCRSWQRVQLSDLY